MGDSEGQVALALRALNVEGHFLVGGQGPALLHLLGQERPVVQGHAAVLGLVFVEDRLCLAEQVPEFNEIALVLSKVDVAERPLEALNDPLAGAILPCVHVGLQAELQQYLNSKNIGGKSVKSVNIVRISYVRIGHVNEASPQQCDNKCSCVMTPSKAIEAFVLAV